MSKEEKKRIIEYALQCYNEELLKELYTCKEIDKKNYSEEIKKVKLLRREY